MAQANSQSSDKPSKAVTKKTVSAKRAVKSKTAAAHKRSPATNKVTAKPKKAVKAGQPVSKPTTKSVYKPTRPYRFMRLRAFIGAPIVGRLFVLASLLILFGSVILWSLLAARLQLANADQLADANLFQDWQSFHSAGFPGAHTFLIKWPLFALLGFFNSSPHALASATVALTVLTVLLLVLFLYKIERRPYIFGTLLLVLTSVLLLIPTQPYPGALLPVNMAMTTTRNIEYAIYLASIYGIMRARRWTSASFWVATVLLTLVVASDKLFMALSVGAALICLAGWLWRSRRQLSKVRPWRISRWIVSALLASAAATGLLVLIDSLGLTQIVGSGSTSPYPLVHSVSALADGAIYALMAVLTNVGANSVHGVIVVRELPTAILHSLGRLSSLAYIWNSVFLLVSLWAAYRVIRSGKRDRASLTALGLLASTVAAGLVFVLTDHYYPVDARYLTVELFALFVTTTVYLRNNTPRLRFLLSAAVITVLLIPIAVLTMLHEYHDDRQALAQQENLSRLVADELRKNHIDKLIGNYWQAVPVKAYDQQLTVLPVNQCIQPQKALASQSWFNLKPGEGVAYLAIRDNSTTVTFNGCTLAQLSVHYGEPISTTVLTGSASDPQALLLFYPFGLGHGHYHLLDRQVLAVHQALALSAMDRNACPAGMVLNVVAHEDDDLLFLSPDLLHDIHAGKCIRTVYLTAGDAGRGLLYWQNREAGAQAAYAEMYGVGNHWHQAYAKLNNRPVNVYTLASVPQLSLLFMNLPDGGPHGHGFVPQHVESLQDLRFGKVKAVNSIDGLAHYSKDDLTNSLLQLLQLDKPEEVHSQGYDPNIADGDHSDHHAAGYFTEQAFNRYDGHSKLIAYQGYPVQWNYPNVEGVDLEQKQQAFLAYSHHDGAVCHSIEECDSQTIYGAYLHRQYNQTLLVK